MICGSKIKELRLIQFLFHVLNEHFFFSGNPDFSFSNPNPGIFIMDQDLNRKRSYLHCDFCQQFSLNCNKNLLFVQLGNILLVLSRVVFIICIFSINQLKYECTRKIHFLLRRWKGIWADGSKMEEKGGGWKRGEKRERI